MRYELIRDVDCGAFGVESVVVDLDKPIVDGAPVVVTFDSGYPSNIPLSGLLFAGSERYAPPEVCESATPRELPEGSLWCYVWNATRNLVWRERRVPCSANVVRIVAAVEIVTECGVTGIDEFVAAAAIGKGPMCQPKD